MLAGSELEVSHRQPAEVRPAGPHAAGRHHAAASDLRQERCPPRNTMRKTRRLPLPVTQLQCFASVLLAADAEAGLGESETERWAREHYERRQARARKKAQRSGEVSGTRPRHLQEVDGGEPDWGHRSSWRKYLQFVPLQSDDNEPSGEEEFPGSGLDPQVCVRVCACVCTCVSPFLSNMFFFLCLQTVRHSGSR